MCLAWVLAMDVVQLFFNRGTETNAPPCLKAFQHHTWPPSHLNLPAGSILTLDEKPGIRKMCFYFPIQHSCVHIEAYGQYEHTAIQIYTPKG